MCLFFTTFHLTLSLATEHYINQAHHFAGLRNHIGRYGAEEDIELLIIAIAILIIAYMFTNDANVASLGLVSSAACFGLFGLTNSDWMIYGGNTLI